MPTSRHDLLRGMPRSLAPAFLAVCALFATTSVVAELKIEESVAGPVTPDAKYIVSPKGGHLAVVARKGSRMNVVVDGVAGPRVDEVVTPAAPYIDPRPYNEEGRRANTQPANIRPTAAVTFSRDGKRHAYVARISQEWVLFADGKEVLRIPVAGAVGATSGVAGMAGNTDVRLEFTGEEGIHLLFARSTFEGFDLWVDGQKWPGHFMSGGGGTAGTVDPITSPDGKRIAYIAQLDRDKQTLIVDGKDAGYLGDNLEFSADSKHLFSLSRTAKGNSVLVDGKPLFTAKEINSMHVSPTGSRLGVVIGHFNKQTESREGVVLVLDGKPVEASLSDEIKSVIFSPDGKHYAAMCGRGGARFMVHDGKKGQEYQDIVTETPGLTQGPMFSPDSSKLIYVANATGKSFLVTNDDESDAMEGFVKVYFSPDKKHTAVTGRMSQSAVVLMDGKSQQFPGNQGVDPVVFSPDSSRYACGAFVDGKPTGMTGEFSFSPDSKHYVVATPSYQLVVDGKVIATNNMRGRSFSPDGKHLCWICREPATAPGAAPGTWEMVMYVDGNPVQRFDDYMNALGELRQMYREEFRSKWATPHEWVFSDDGKLSFLAVVGDSVKRFTLTLPPDTSLETAMEKADKAKVSDASPAAPANNRSTGQAVAGSLSPTGASTAKPAGAPTGVNPALAAGAPAILQGWASGQSPAATATGVANQMAKAKADAAKAKARADATAKAKAWLDSLSKK